MLTRTAIYEGRVRDAREEEFFRRVRDELEPFWRRFPGVTAVRIQRVVSKDADARPIAMILEMDFPDQAALDACLASPIRPESHPRHRGGDGDVRRPLLPSGQHRRTMSLVD